MDLVTLTQLMIKRQDVERGQFKDQIRRQWYFGLNHFFLARIGRLVSTCTTLHDYYSSRGSEFLDSQDLVTHHNILLSSMV